MALGRLHLITDARPGRDVLAVVGAALSVGAPVVQVRVEDGVSDRSFFDLASRVVGLCRSVGAQCLVNDRVDIALAVGADGVHLGAEDLPVSVARSLAPSLVIGATGIARGADYLGIGPCFSSAHKPGKPPIGAAGIAAVGGFVPVIAIGGITVEQVPAVLAAGAYGVAVISAIADAADPAAATAAFLRALS